MPLDPGENRQAKGAAVAASKSPTVAAEQLGFRFDGE